MGRVLLEGGIIILLVLIGVSVFVPSNENSVNDVIVEFEQSVQNGEIVSDGEIKEVEVSVNDDSTFISRVNCKIANIIVNGLNSVFEFGMNLLRKIIN